MKSYIAILAATATALSPVAAAAFNTGTLTGVTDPTANPADSFTLAAMKSACDALALQSGPATSTNSDIYRGVVVAGAVTLSGTPSENAGVRGNITHLTGTGTYTPATKYIVGEPFRIGGSVNMFGDQWSDNGSWSSSTYDFTASFHSEFLHAFGCQVQKSVYHAPVHHDGHPVQGFYSVNKDAPGSSAGHQSACDAYTAMGPRAYGDEDYKGIAPWWGIDVEPGFDNGPDQSWCDWNKTADEEKPYDDPATWDAFANVGDVVPQDAVSQGQDDTLAGHETAGAGVKAEGGPFHIGQVVICISPSTSSKKTTANGWALQNGYTGTNCTTDWFKNHAVWGSGTESSNGTYTAVPNYTLY